MRIARSLLALAALCSAAACADGASRITAPAAASHDAAPGGTWAGSGNVVTPGDTTGGASASNGGTWIGSGNVTPPADTTGDGRGGTWIGSGN